MFNIVGFTSQGKPCCATKCKTITIEEPIPALMLNNLEEKNQLNKELEPKKIENPSVIKSNQEIEKFIIHPNPTTSKFRIKSSTIDLKIKHFESVEIIDESGKIMNTFTNINSDYEYNLSEYSKGIYLIRVKTGNNY